MDVPACVLLRGKSEDTCSGASQIWISMISPTRATINNTIAYQTLTTTCEPYAQVDIPRRHS